MRSRGEGGSATANAVVWIGVITAMAMACVLAAAVITTHRRSQAAADLAALAGAQALQRGADGCRAAAVNAGRNRAELLRCASVDSDMVVTVAAVPPDVFGAALTVPARARAGPSAEGGLGPRDLLP